MAQVRDKNSRRHHNIFVQFGQLIPFISRISSRRIRGTISYEILMSQFHAFTNDWLSGNCRKQSSICLESNLNLKIHPSTKSSTLKLRPCFGVSLLVCLAVGQHLFCSQKYLGLVTGMVRTSAVSISVWNLNNLNDDTHSQDSSGFISATALP